MGDNDRRQARSELQIFKEFSRAASVLVDSIESREPPEPDILCHTANGGSVAFELVELIDPSLSRRVSDKIKIERELRDALQASDPPVAEDIVALVVFKPDASFKARSSSAKSVVSELAQLPTGYAGDVVIKNKNLRSIVGRIIIGRGGSGGGPSIGMHATGSFSDPTIEVIRGKLEKSYSTDSPLELLAYYELQPSEVASGWAPPLSAIENIIDASIFRRVWIYNKLEAVVEWVYPLLPRDGT